METQIKKEYFPPAISEKLLNSEDEQDKELVRIGKLSNQLWANYDFETRVDEPFQLLAAVICNLDARYFYASSINTRKSTAQLLSPAIADDVKRLYKFVAESELSDFLKAVLCGEAAGWLKTNGASAGELGQLKRSFDVEAFREEFWKED